jgi:23S rRNA (uridine2552-2'-O)-methyltransferase
LGRRRHPRDRSDHFARRARRESYPARSVYKLEEIDRRIRLLAKGDAVLDLGAAPGSWTLFASEKVGPSGRVVALDRSPLEIAAQKNVTQIEADVFVVQTADLLGAINKDAYDAVISDMAPRTTGQRFIDQTRSHELFTRALELAVAICRPGGRFVGKIFQGPDFEEARSSLGRAFSKTRIIRPASVRSESFEIYLIGLDRR